MKRKRIPRDIELKMISSLRDKGYKLTSQRLEIIRVLLRDASHPGAMTILRKVREKVPKIGMSTIYYTLDMLKREGLIRELDFYDRNNRYDANVQDHINLICLRCGRIEDYTEAMPFSSETIEELTGFRPLGMRFEYYGYCKECRRARKR